LPLADDLDSTLRKELVAPGNLTTAIIYFIVGGYTKKTLFEN